MQGDTKNSRLAAALSYAGKGYRVFPLMPGKKRPATKNGLNDGTTDQRRIRTWWRNDPNRNIGLCTEGLCVVDVDNPPGSNNPWPATLGKHKAALNSAPTAETPRGGTHHVFRTPIDRTVTSSTGQVADKVDIRGDGGYIVVGPSNSPAGGWSWKNVEELPDRSKLPLAPDWLLNTVGKKHSPVLGAGGEPAGGLQIDEGSRNAALTSIAGAFRRIGLPSPLLANVLKLVNDETCVVPLDHDEVERIASSVSRYAAGAEFAQCLNGDGGFSFNFQSLDDFLNHDFNQSYLVDGVVVTGEHLVIGGPQKAFKTSIALDLGVSVATGSAFLGHFSVPEPKTALVVTGESGGATVQKSIKAVLESKGNPEHEGRFHISVALPNLTQTDHLAKLQEEIEQREASLAVIDPAYLTLLAGKADVAGNVFAMGDVLRGLGAVGISTGCTIGLVHHTVKSKNDNNASAPGLASLSQSGFAEWARQWILLNHRSRLQRGEAKLNMKVGGSAGHWGEYHLDIHAGDPKDALVARQWNVLWTI